MKKLFIIATALFIIGIGLPILAANSGGACEKKKCRKEKSELAFVNENHENCKKKKEVKETQQNISKEVKKEKAPLEKSSLNTSKVNENENLPNTSFNFLYYLFYKSSINDFFKSPGSGEPAGSSQ